MEKITATEWSFMLCAMIRGQITLFSKTCTARYASKTQTGVMPPSPKANKRAGTALRMGPR